MAAQIASASDNRNTVVTREKGIRGDSGTDGQDGAGFESVRGSKLDNPNTQILAPNKIASRGFGGVTWLRSSVARGLNKYDQLAEAGINTPRESRNGWTLEGAKTNFVLDSDNVSSQGISVSSTEYTISFYGTGTLDLSGAFVGSLNGTGASERVQLTFTPATGTLNIAPSGQVENCQLEFGNFATSYITSELSPGQRSPDIVSLPAFGNSPLLSEDFSLFFNVYFNGFTGGDDFIFSIPNGINNDLLTVCCFANNGSLTFRISDGLASVDASLPVAANQRYSVVIRKDQDSIKIQVDDNEAQELHNLTPPIDLEEQIKIGGNLSGTTKNSYIELYDFRVYGFYLNDDETQFLIKV